MNDNDVEFVAVHVRAALPPCLDRDLHRDLWPEMLLRMQDAPVSFGWFEAALASLIVGSVAAFPELLPLMLFHM
jgi:hypothetical protein